MFIVALLIPVIMICFGRKFMKSAPKDINIFYGYRTSMSMKNRETWEFAHNYWGKLCYKTGKLLLISALFLIFVIGKDENVIGVFGTILVFIQMIPLITSLFATEKALKKNFDKNGNRIK